MAENLRGVNNNLVKKNFGNVFWGLDKKFIHFFFNLYCFET